jgi:hypothetical protein
MIGTLIADINQKVERNSVAMLFVQLCYVIK